MSRFHLAGIRTSKFFNPGICHVLTMHAYVLYCRVSFVHMQAHEGTSAELHVCIV